MMSELKEAESNVVRSDATDCSATPRRVIRAIGDEGVWCPKCGWVFVFGVHGGMTCPNRDCELHTIQFEVPVTTIVEVASREPLLERDFDRPGKPQAYRKARVLNP